jgi:hypothetical protein
MMTDADDSSAHFSSSVWHAARIAKREKRREEGGGSCPASRLSESSCVCVYCPKLMEVIDMFRIVLLNLHKDNSYIYSIEISVESVEIEKKSLLGPYNRNGAYVLHLCDIILRTKRTNEIKIQTFPFKIVTAVGRKLADHKFTAQFTLTPEGGNLRLKQNGDYHDKIPNLRSSAFAFIDPIGSRTKDREQSPRDGSTRSNSTSTEKRR